MDEAGPALWMFAIAGGAIILIAALVYGITRNRHRSREEREVTDAATRAEYRAEDGDKS